MQLHIFTLCFCVLALLISGQTRAETPFERAVAYASMVDELNRMFSTSLANAKDSWDKLQEVGLDLREAIGDSQSIQQAGYLQEAATALAMIDFQQRRRSLMESASRQRSLDQSAAAWLLTLKTSDLLTAASQLSQLQYAKQSTSRRVQVLAAVFGRLTGQLRRHVESNQQQFERYRDLADIFGLRSKLELQAALRELKHTDPENLGAVFMEAVTKRRLGQFEAAESTLSDLAELDTFYRPLFVAARAEALYLQGNEQESSKLLAQLKTTKATQAHVLSYRGLIAANSDLSKATTFWERALTLSAPETPLRRNLAIAYATHPRRRRAESRRALEHAELASQLSLGEQWSVELARSLALNANGQETDALAAADKARQLASDDGLAYCTEIIDKLKNNEPIQWDFVKH